jgi:hypothetical protein
MLVRHFFLCENPLIMTYISDKFFQMTPVTPKPESQHNKSQYNSTQHDGG